VLCVKQPARIVAAPAALPPGAPNEPAELTFADLDAAAAAFGLSADETAKALHWGYAVQHPVTEDVHYLTFAEVEGAEYGRWAAVVLVRPFSSVMKCPAAAQTSTCTCLSRSARVLRRVAWLPRHGRVQHGLTARPRGVLFPRWSARAPGAPWRCA